MNVVLLIVILYLVICMLMGAYGKTKTHTAVDFLIANRRMPWWVASLSIAATLIGSGVTLGVGELGYSIGISGVLYPLCLAFGLIICMALAAARFRQSDAYTVPELFERYYGVESRVWVAVVNTIPLISMLAGQFLAGGVVLSAVTDMPIHWCIHITAMIVILYVCIGGIWAVSLTDCFQTIVIYSGLIALAVVTCIKFGGWSTLLSQLPPGHSNWLAAGRYRLSSYIGCVLMFWFISQPWLQRCAASKSPQEARKAGLLASLLIFPIGFLAIFAGLVARLKLPGIDPTQAVPLAMLEFFPPIVGGVFCAGIIAACMSCSDSWLHASATIVVKDIYERLFNSNASDKKMLAVSIAVCGAIGGLGWLLALIASQEIVALVLLFVAFQPIYIAPLFSAWFCHRRRLTRWAAFGNVAVATGLAAAFTVYQPWGLHPVIPTALVAYGLTALCLILPYTSCSLKEKTTIKCENM
ncbi:MAG TPA: sodium:solute symporter family protein [Thermoplasmata archaeon]|nr:sodium:solute symporter family protein [Thermoplasmata archaeon]